MCPGYREVFQKANTVTELSGLEINLVYSHQNTRQDIPFKGPLMGSNCCHTELPSVKLTSVILHCTPVLGKALESNRISLYLIQQSSAEQ